MSSYFDAFDRTVREISRMVTRVGQTSEERHAAFVIELEKLEEKMIKDCEYFAGDIETPESVRKCIMAVIALAGVKHSPKAREQAGVCYISTLSRDMHGLWHDIARMRYQMRYGMVSDDPEEAVARRDNFAENRKGPHPWQKKGGKPNHLEIGLNDAPFYCRKALTLD